MNLYRILAAIAVLALIAPFAIGQDGKEGNDADRKTESKEEDNDAKEEGDDFDRGDAKAEKMFKRAYTRVYSAEAQGLKKLHATADIAVDASAFGMGEMPFEGQITWATGGKAVWESTEEDDGSSPLGNVSGIAKGLFEPYLAYVTGFEAWDARFAKAGFEFGDPQKDEDGKETAKTVIVDYADEERGDETFAIAENKVISLSHESEVQGQKANVIFKYEYEDLGKQLRLTTVTAATEIDMAGMPGQEPDPKNPVPKGASKEKLEGKIEVKKYGKAGEFEIALELEGGLSLMGMEFPTTLTLSNAKVNDEVKEEDLPDENKEEESDDDEF